MTKETVPGDKCSCGSGETFSSCCEPLLKGLQKATTAGQLMRSRYSAYAHGFIDYLIETTHISQRKYHSKKETRKWAEANEWLKLEIVSESERVVEFKAFFRNKQGLQVHHERSTFQLEGGKWYFVDGVFPG